MSIQNLLSKLAAAEINLTGEELADIMWLMLQSEQSCFSELNNQEVARNPSQNFILPVVEDKPEIADTQPPTQPSFNSQESPTPSKDSQLKADIYAQTASTINNQESKESKGVGKLPIRVPDAAALPNKLGLARSLRPLMRRVHALYDTVLDEVATTERIATKQFWIPVLKPTLERWLELALVIDEGASMMCYTQTMMEFKRLLEVHGAFRSVQTWGLDVDSRGKLGLKSGYGRNEVTWNPKKN